MAKDDFFEIELSGERFVATLSADGPYIQRRKRNIVAHDGVALGSATLITLVTHDPRGRSVPEGTWAVCKYGSHEPRIVLEGWAEPEVRKLAEAFGINTRFLFGESPRFAESPAWEALCAWVDKHPRIAKSYARYDHYIAGWYEAAVRRNERDRAAALEDEGTAAPSSVLS